MKISLPIVIILLTLITFCSACKRHPQKPTTEDIKDTVINYAQHNDFDKFIQLIHADSNIDNTKIWIMDTVINLLSAYNVDNSSWHSGIFKSPKGRLYYYLSATLAPHPNRELADHNKVCLLYAIKDKDTALNLLLYTPPFENTDPSKNSNTIAQKNTVVAFIKAGQANYVLKNFSFADKTSAKAVSAFTNFEVPVIFRAINLTKKFGINDSTWRGKFYQDKSKRPYYILSASFNHTRDPLSHYVLSFFYHIRGSDTSFAFLACEP